MNAIFWVLHIVALFAMWPALFITVPLHIMVSVLAKK